LPDAVGAADTGGVFGGFVHTHVFARTHGAGALAAVYDYDALVPGSGPGDQKAVIATAKLGRCAAVVELRDMVGGVCINTGTIPSKTLREAVLYLTGLSQREMYGQSYRVEENITIADLIIGDSYGVLKLLVSPEDRSWLND
jgi:hypothetical protein